MSCKICRPGPLSTVLFLRALGNLKHFGRKKSKPALKKTAPTWMPYQDRLDVLFKFKILSGNLDYWPQSACVYMHAYIYIYIHCIYICYAHIYAHLCASMRIATGISGWISATCISPCQNMIKYAKAENVRWKTSTAGHLFQLLCAHPDMPRGKRRGIHGEQIIADRPNSKSWFQAVDVVITLW